METMTVVVGLVRELVDAENQGGAKGRDRAKAVLAPNFGVITRSSGVEEARAALLNAIGAEPNPKKQRKLEDEFCARVGDRVAVVRTVVRVSEGPEKGPWLLTGRFRNMHVFEEQDGQWRCVAWQVTRLDDPPAPKDNP